MTDCYICGHVQREDVAQQMRVHGTGATQLEINGHRSINLFYLMLNMLRLPKIKTATYQ